MKKIKSIVALVLVCSLLFAFSACGGDKTYSVTVKDALGNPYKGVVVNFMQDGKNVAMQACDENGIATKKLAKGEYTISLSFTGTGVEYYYDENQTVTANKNEIDLIVAYKLSGETKNILVPREEDRDELLKTYDSFDVYYVSAGCTYVELSNEHRNFFLFTPKEAGNYEFSIIGDANVQFGNYGSPSFVQLDNISEVTDNKFTESINAGMLGSSSDGGAVTYVLGIDALDANATNCILAINRIGDPIKTFVDEPWTVYQSTTDIAKYTLPAGVQIKEFDLTASTDTYKLVYNEDEGFYHLNTANGPLVLVRLTENSDYIDCFKKITDSSHVMKYFFDDNGDFVKKESYSECLLNYIECVDETEGVYPLDEDLKYIIQQFGDYQGWWDINSMGYIFKTPAGTNDSSINADIAWLLMCCYVG